jgi:hypothetical protein
MVDDKTNIKLICINISQVFYNIIFLSYLFNLNQIKIFFYLTTLFSFCKNVILLLCILAEKIHNNTSKRNYFN